MARRASNPIGFNEFVANDAGLKVAVAGMLASDFRLQSVQLTQEHWERELQSYLSTVPDTYKAELAE